MGSFPSGAAPPINFPEFTPDYSHSSIWHLSFRIPPTPLPPSSPFPLLLPLPLGDVCAALLADPWLHHLLPQPSQHTKAHLPKRPLCSWACPSQEPSVAPAVWTSSSPGLSRPSRSGPSISIQLDFPHLVCVSSPPLSKSCLAVKAGSNTFSNYISHCDSFSPGVTFTEGEKNHAVKPQSRIFSTSSQT